MFKFKEYKAVKLAHIQSLPTETERQKARVSKRNPLPQCTEDAVRYIQSMFFHTAKC